MLSSFYPVVAGRISDATMRTRSLYQAQVGKMDLQRLQDQLSTGLRYSLPSQDPTSAMRVIGFQREIEFKGQTLRNLDSAQSYLSASESHLASVQNILTEMRGLGTEAATNVAGPEERNIWLNQIDNAIDRLIATSNSTFLDRYLFSGGVVGTPTTSQTNEGVIFNGNDMSMLSLTDTGDYVSHNVTGQKALGLLSEAVISSKDLDPNAIPSTRLLDLNQGKGITPGAIQFSNGLEKVTIDLSNSATVDDILQGVSGKVSLAGREVNVSLVDGAFVVQYADGLPGTLRVQNVGSGRTASDLGIATSDPLPTLPIQGKSLDPIMKLTTPLSQLNGGSGFNWDEGIKITQGGKEYNISFSGAETVEDVINRVHASGVAATMSITPDGSSLQIKSRLSGVDFSVGESTGNLADSLGLRTFKPQTRLSELNYGRGFEDVQGPDIIFRRNDGTELSVDLQGTNTVQDVLDRINNHADNQDPLTKITVAMRADGNGLTVSSSVPAIVPDPDPGPVTIRSAGGSEAAYVLGLVPHGLNQSTATSNGTEFVFSGTDPNPQEINGVFNSLIRFRNAIASEDLNAVSRAVQLMDQDLERLGLSRGSLGVEQQRIDDLKLVKEDSLNLLKENESKNIEADMLSVISELNARQVANEASLKLLAGANQMSLFNYL